MFKKLYLIRHGETEGADAKRYKGHIDVPLSGNGIRQIERLSKYIVQDSSTFKDSNKKPNPPSPPFSKGGQGGLLNAVYCSDLSRAVNSAEIIARPHSLEPVVMKDLKERNFGLWEGMSFDEIKEKYPSEFRAWADDPVKFSPVGGENTIEVRDRAVRALGEIISLHSNDKDNAQSSLNGLNSLNHDSIAIVCHGGISRVILCHFLGIPLENIFRIEQDFAAVNIIEIYDGFPVVKLVNHVV